MTFDILENILGSAHNPGETADYLTQQLRELTGARTIILLQYLNELGSQGYQAVSVLPPRRLKLAQSNAVESMAGLVHRLNKTTIWDPTDPDCEAAPLLAETGHSLSIAVPLQANSKHVGALLLLGLPDPHGLEVVKETVNVLSTVVALIFRNALLYENQEAIIQTRTRELSLLNRVMAAAVGSSNIVTVLEVACRELAETFALDRVLASLMSKTGDEMTVVAECITLPGLPSFLHRVIPVSSVAPGAVDTHQPYVIENAPQSPLLQNRQQEITQAQTQSLLVIPLIANSRRMGVLSLSSSTSRRYSDDEIDLAQRVAEQISAMITRLNLTKQEQLLSVALEQTAESVIITDANGTIVYVNQAFETITGYEETEALGQSPRLLKSGEQTADFYKDLWDTITDGRAWQGRMVNRRKDGSLITVDVIISPLTDGNGHITNYIGVQRDITEELKRQAAYEQAQKMEAIGHLTAGIAHDFNNLLTAINGFAELVLMRLSPDSPNRHSLDKILQAGQSAARLVEQLLGFSRKQIIQPQILDLNEKLTEITSLLQRVLGEDIMPDVQLAPTLWPIKIDPTQLEQVLLNLAANARDAMAQGGTLSIVTENVVLDDTYAATHVETPAGPYVRLSVTDTGRGIPAKDLPHIFEPFYTTKEMGRGTGLGLATVFGIIKQNNGNIGLYSEEGFGTTFHIYLPKVETTCPEESERLPEHLQTAGSETILLVDDNSEIRMFARDVLGAEGYTVLEADSAEAALRVAANVSQSQPIDLLLTDVILPQMNGNQLAQRLLQTTPQLKVLFISGYTTNVIVHRGGVQKDVALLTKPFNIDTLLNRVRTTLDEDGQ